MSLLRKNDDKVSMTIENTWSGTDIDRWQRRDTSQRRMSVVFSNKIKIQGDWDFDLAKMGKLHFIIDEDGKRVPMSLKYEQAREKRIQRQVFNRWRYYKRPKVTIKLDPMDITLLMDDKSESKKRECMLPWWCIFLPWLMVVLTTVTCAFFTILYTFNFGRHKSLKWLRSLFTSFVSDVFFNQPLTILFVACFFTFIIKRSELENLELNVDVSADVSEDDERDKYRVTAEKQAISMLRLDPIYRPPSQVHKFNHFLLAEYLGLVTCYNK